MTEQDWKQLQAHLTLPPHTPPKTQVDLLKDDVLKLVDEVMRLRNALSLVERGGSDPFGQQQRLDESHATGGEAMRQACLEVACMQCYPAIIRLSARRTHQ